jgi:prepilin-type N-terminal cleavage/methylation domain-containing protein
MRKAFTLAEILIVVGIIGIIAAIVLPEFKNHTQKAKEAAAKDNLRIMRQQIELYAFQHGISPGYLDNDPAQPTNIISFRSQLIGGGYLKTIPDNPMTGEAGMKMIQDNEEFPTEYVPSWSIFDWLYQARTKTIKLHASGSDSDGVAYFDY